MTLRQPKILIVDGDRADLETMRQRLSKLRCQVVVVQTGNAALAACVRDDFAMIFLDAELPDMDGYEVAELLKGEASTQHIPIIFVTAAPTDEAHRLRCYEMGAIDYIEKSGGEISIVSVLSKAELLLDLYASKQQLKLELARSETMRVAARENEVRYREAIDSAPIPIMLHAEDGEVILANRRWLELTGYARNELPSVDAWITKTCDPSSEALRSRIGRLYGITGVMHEGEYPVQTAQGAVLRWDFCSAPLAALPDGRRLVLTMAQDVTAHRATLRAAAEAKRMAESADRAKGEFLANMSHEIRTPLHVIMGLGHLLRRDIKDPEPLARLNQICATSEHLLAIINDVLDLSKIEAQRLVLDHNDFQIEALVDKVVQLVEGPAHQKGLRLTTNVAPQLHHIALNGDALRLAQVLINLCGNAVKFTDQGTVRLGIACVAEYADRVDLRFTVEDTGIGITLTDQARLFQPFEQADGSMTRKRGGTGLGLAISQRLVALMGGTIRVDSIWGAGSTFSFELVMPHANTRVLGTTVTVAPTATDFRGRHILFAEDHPLSQEILFEMLESLHCEVEVVSDGAEAVACAQERSYDLILMDMQMPKMDGLAATRAIRTLPQHHDTPIIALTANAFAEDRRRCLEAGMNGHMSKPVTPDSLAAGLSQWLSGLATPNDEAPDCNSELSRALAEIPGLEVGQVWRSSPEGLADYCTQLNRFVTQNGRDMGSVREHLANDERDAAHLVAHKLTGIAGLIGARRVASLTTELVIGLRSGADVSMLEQLVDACDSELASLTKAARTLPVLSLKSARMS